MQQHRTPILLAAGMALLGVILIIGGCRTFAASEDAAMASAEAWSISQDPLSTQADIEAALTKVAEKVAAIDVARKLDQAEIRSALAGAIAQGAGGGGLIGAAGIVLSWIMRDRRKKRGTDPLQLATVSTPMPQAGSGVSS